MEKPVSADGGMAAEAGGNAAEDGRIAWEPGAETRARARLTRFMAATGAESWDALHRRSVEDVAGFTEAVLRFLDIRFDTPYAKVMDASRGPASVAWCVGGRMNITVSCLDKHRGTPAWSQPALIWEGEESRTRTLTFAELHDAVERCAAGLRALGLGKGDAIALHLPMVPETAIALLAVGRIGAVAVPLFSGYGPAAIAARLQDVEAKALFTCAAFPRRGKPVAAKLAADEALASCPGVAHVIVVGRPEVFPAKPGSAPGKSLQAGPVSALGAAPADAPGTAVPLRAGRDLAFEDLLRAGDAAPASARQAEILSAEDPLLVLYTSGTTGRPKGIVHSHCGFPVKAAQDMAFGTDVGPGDRIAWVTDIGWMMGPWMLYGAAILGATAVLYDGAPDFPGPDRLWEFAARHRVGILGVSPSLIRALAVHGRELPARHDLSTLRILASTGEPWDTGSWRWLFEAVGGRRLPIINYSGGTEISGGILMGNPLLPIKPCSFPAACPGIDADVADPADPEGRSFNAAGGGAGTGAMSGGVGELVIRKPWIGMARGFWKDRERYLETYWSRWRDVWVHGDWVRRDAGGHWYILGRSDDTLKVAGKRVGPAEVESILAAHPAVAAAAVVGVPDDKKGTAMVAFCVLKPAGTGAGTTSAGTAEPAGDLRAKAAAELAEALRAKVAAELGRPLSPEAVHFVAALPRTRNAKVMRRVLRAAYLGEDAGDVTALENPESVAAIRGLGRRDGREDGPRTGVSGSTGVADRSTGVTGT